MSAVRSCVEQLYLEVFPEDGIEDQLLGFPDGAYIGVTCSPKRGLDTVRNQGITLPVWIGLAGRLLRSNNYRPESLVLELASKIEDRDVGIDRLYLFSFNQVKDTVAWRDELSRRFA